MTDIGDALERTIKMPKSRKRKTKGTKKRRTIRGLSSKTQAGSVQQRIRTEKERLLSVLHFDESLRGRVEEMFDINLEGLPVGQEPMFFSTAVFKINDAESAMAKIEQLRDVELTDEDEEAAYYVWTRTYPKGHWNPMSNVPGARQILGNIQVNSDNTLQLETKTKGWMTGLIYHMMDALGVDVELISLEFENPLDILRGDS